MIIFAALAGLLFFAFIGWSRRQRVFVRGEWRLGAGFLALGSLVAALFLAVRAEWAPAAAMLAVAGVLTGVSRTQRGSSPKPTLSATPGELSRAQARSILGVSETAGPAEIRAAYSRLMRKNHPDVGGTDGLAAQLNAARDRLLRP